MTGRMHAMRHAAGAPARMPSLSELGARVGATMVRAFAAVAAWRARGHERAALATLDDRALRDIGLTRAETWVEVEKPYWHHP